jgi:vancomycin resistance protein VanJ
MVSWNRIKIIPIIGVWGYGLLACLALLLRLTVGEMALIRIPLDDLLCLLWFPALILLPFTLLTRRWWLSVVLAPTALILLITFGPAFLPRTRPLPPDRTPIRLLTYNLHAEQAMLQPMIDLIREADADVVALQEMSTVMADALDAQLATVYPYRALYREPHNNPYHGRGILSRYPIVAAYTEPTTYPLPFRMQWAHLQVDDHRIAVYNLHTAPSYPIFGQGMNLVPAEEQTLATMRLIESETIPTLLLCDCNSQPLSENYAHITRLLRDSYGDVGWGLGFTGPDWGTTQSNEGPAFVPPYQRIDYIFHSADFTALEPIVWPHAGGSDHRPVIARLAF